MKSCISFGLFSLSLLLSAHPAVGQFSGFVSGSYGYNSNPLYNYAAAPDRLTEGYIELSYTEEAPFSRLFIGYVGGLMLFDSNAERSYYEHRFAGSFTKRLTNRSANHTGENPGDVDSMSSYLDAGLTLGMRHDKATYQEYDNVGVDGYGAYRFRTGGLTYARLVGDVGYRGYPNVQDLSNVTGTLPTYLGMRSYPTLDAGLLLFAGVKHFANATYDTTVFATSSGNGKGKGQGQGQGQGQGGSNKQGTLVNATTTTTYQLAVGLFVDKTWVTRGFSANFIYRYNPSTGSRYVAQYPRSTILTEDIYNDYFDYQGPGLKFVFRQRLPLEIQATFSAEGEIKKFNGPALDLAGNETASTRNDVCGMVDLLLSKDVPLSAAVSLTAGMSAGTLRNQSNDAYHDYSGFRVSLSLGLGF